MELRTFRAGDEAALASVYNEAAGPLPGFKPATEEEVRRRCSAADFDPATRVIAEDAGRVVGYCTFHGNGRVSFPWCLPAARTAADGLFEAARDAMRRRGLRLAFAAYRADWTDQGTFFQERGFRHARDMVNFTLDLADLPTRLNRPGAEFSSLRREDLPAVWALAPQALRARGPAELERHLCDNPYFTSGSAFVRRRKDGTPAAVGVLIRNPAFADPQAVDPAMPCFRLGAFGTEGMQAKRINGLFSVLAADGPEFNPLALSCLQHAAFWMEAADQGKLAAQAPSDVPHLLRFYQHHFRRQGSFPVLEHAL